LQQQIQQFARIDWLRGTVDSLPRGESVLPFRFRYHPHTISCHLQQRKNSKHRCATRTLLTSAPPFAKPAFAPVVSSNDERPAETSEMHDLQQQKHMLSIYVCATSNCSSCRWALLFLAASRGQIGGYSDGRRRGSSPIDAPRRTSAPWTPPPIRYWLKSPLPRPNVDAQRPPSPANDRRDSSAIANSFPRHGPPIKAPPPHLMRAGLGPPPIRGPPPHLVRDGLGQPPIKAPPAHLVRAGLGPLPIKAPPPHFV